MKRRTAKKKDEGLRPCAAKVIPHGMRKGLKYDPVIEVKIYVPKPEKKVDVPKVKRQNNKSLIVKKL